VPVRPRLRAPYKSIGCIFSLLVVSLDGKELAVAVIPVSSMLSLKLIAKAFGEKKAAMASRSDVERSTGYVLDGVSWLGQKNQLRRIIDISASNHSSVFVSAGRRGLEIELNLDDLKKLVNGVFAEVCQ